MTIIHEENNKNYCSVDGNLFSKDKSTLIQYAIGKEDTQYVIPSGVTNIESFAFSNGDNLTSITIPDSVTNIDVRAFANIFSNLSITIPNSVTSIREDAFANTVDLTIYGYTGSTAEEYAKEYGIQFVALSDEIVASGTCGDNLTWNLYQSGTLKISGSGELTEFDHYYIFNGNLNIIISEGVTKICKQAFDVRGCDVGSMQIKLPSSLEEIGGYAFNGCDNVTISLNPENDNFNLVDSVLYSADMKSLVYASSSKKGDFVVPSSVLTVCDGAFASSSLTSVTIPDTIVSMVSEEYGRVFANAKCKRVYIGKNVAYLDRCCFYECENLEELYIFGTKTEAEEAFVCRCYDVTVYMNRNSKMAECYAEGYFDEVSTVEYIDNYSTTVGDLSGDGEVTSEDAIYLLYHTFWPLLFSVFQIC